MQGDFFRTLHCYSIECSALVETWFQKITRKWSNRVLTLSLNIENRSGLCPVLCWSSWKFSYEEGRSMDTRVVWISNRVPDCGQWSWIGAEIQEKAAGQIINCVIPLCSSVNPWKWLSPWVQASSHVQAPQEVKPTSGCPWFIERTSY